MQKSFCAELFVNPTCLPLVAEKGWRVGSLGGMAAFLYAALVEEDDGLVIVQPPAILVIMGLVALVGQDAEAVAS